MDFSVEIKFLFQFLTLSPTVSLLLAHSFTFTLSLSHSVTNSISFFSHSFTFTFSLYQLLTSRSFSFPHAPTPPIHPSPSVSKSVALLLSYTQSFRLSHSLTLSLSHSLNVSFLSLVHYFPLHSLTPIFHFISLPLPHSFSLSLSLSLSLSTSIYLSIYLYVYFSLLSLVYFFPLYTPTPSIFYFNILTLSHPLTLSLSLFHTFSPYHSHTLLMSYFSHLFTISLFTL